MHILPLATALLSMCLCCMQTGRQYVSENSRLCNITCEDGCVYGVSSPIRAQLIELNDRLLSEPQLLTDKACLFCGFISWLVQTVAPCWHLNLLVFQMHYICNFFFYSSYHFHYMSFSLHLCLRQVFSNVQAMFCVSSYF